MALSAKSPQAILPNQLERPGQRERPPPPRIRRPQLRELTLELGRDFTSRRHASLEHESGFGREPQGAIHVQRTIEAAQLPNGVAFCGSERDGVAPKPACGCASLFEIV